MGRMNSMIWSTEWKNLEAEKSKQGLVKEMRQPLASWFSQYVLPERDGARFQVTGLGQAAKIESTFCGEGAFHPVPEDWAAVRKRLFQPL